MPSTPLKPNQSNSWWRICRDKLINFINAQATQEPLEVGQPSKPEKFSFTRQRYKILLIYSLAVTGLIGVLYVACSSIMLSSLSKAEEQDTRQMAKGVLGVFHQTEEDFSARFADWAAWDESYNFIENGNQHYIAASLAPEVLTITKLNLVLYIHSSGRIVFGTGFDYNHKKKTPIPELIRQHLSNDDILLQHFNSKSYRIGIVLLPQGPMLISSRPIVTTQGEGPIRGTIVTGRYLNNDGIEKIARTTRTSLAMYAVNDKNLPPDFKAVQPYLTHNEAIVVRPLNEKTIAGYTLLYDIYDKPALLVRVDIPREIYQQGQTGLQYLVRSLLIVGLLFGGTTFWLLNQLLLFWQQRQEREERYRAVVAQATEGIFLIASDTKRFLEANLAFYDLLDYTNEEVLGLTLYDVVASDHQSVDRDVQQILMQGQNYTSEWQLTRQNGSLLDVEVSANLITYNQRNTLCIVVRDITERKRAEAALRESEQLLSWQASHDPLTELLNRREFERRIKQAIDNAQAGDEQHALLYLDLDQFKIINDTCGHIAGDILLCQVSKLLQSKLRRSDILSRLGGDEFGILLSHCPTEQALWIANQLCQTIQEFRFSLQEKTFAIGVSIGLVFINKDTLDFASALSAADAACYAAKNRGRNRVYVYEIEDWQLSVQRREMQWVARIPKALEENRFRLYYQKIIPLCSNVTYSEHREVLLRLEDEDNNIVLPMAFIPAAERYNLMHLIDRWVISTLFAYLQKQCQDKIDGTTRSPILYAVNLSGASINDEQFIYFLREQFTQFCIPPSIICFEITETLAITQLAKAAQLMWELRALGCRFALDDFGSGMSSFTYLKNLPIDYLKIDGTFIKDVVQDTIAAEMVGAIARIAAVMQIKTIAEFVENDAIITKLKALGLDYAQGYGISQPCPLYQSSELSIVQ